MKKIICTLLIVCLMTVNVSAEEMYSGHPIRWGNFYYLSYVGYVLDVDVYSSQSIIGTEWKNHVSTALSDYRSRTNSLVYAYEQSSFNTANIILSGYAFDKAGDEYIMGITFNYDNDGDRHRISGNPDVGSSSFNSNFDGTVDYSVVYLNNTSIVNSWLQQNTSFAVFGLLHEIGHCFGMGHTASDSIMNYGNAGTASLRNYDVNIINSWY